MVVRPERRRRRHPLRRPLQRARPDVTAPRSPPRAKPRRPPSGRRGSEQQVHLRDLREGRVQPVRAGGRPAGRGDAGPVVQPAVHLRRRRPRQDPPAPRHRALRRPELRPPHRALRVHRALPQRVRRRHPPEHHGALQAPLPRCRCPAHRRHPVHGGQGRAPGGVLPHVQLAARGEQADRHLLRPHARRHPDARGPPPGPVQVGPHHRHPAARPRDAARHPAQQGRAGPQPGAAGGARVHRHPRHRQHPRARGRPHPGVGLRQPQPGAGHRRDRRTAAGRPPEGQPRSSALTPGPHARDHRRLLRLHRRGPEGQEPSAPAGHGSPDRHVRDAGVRPTCRSPPSPGSSADGTTPRSSTPSRRSRSSWPNASRCTTRSSSSPSASRPRAREPAGHRRGTNLWETHERPVDAAAMSTDHRRRTAAPVGGCGQRSSASRDRADVRAGAGSPQSTGAYYHYQAFSPSNEEKHPT